MQADFDLAVLNRQNTETVDPRVLAHLARALRTQPNATGPKEYLISLLRHHSWSLPQSESLRHDDSVTAVSFSDDGRYVITISNNTARVWDAETGSPLGKPLQHGGIIEAASFSPDGRRVVTASSDSTAQVWKRKVETQWANRCVIRAPVHSAKFSPDGHLIVTASDDNTVTNLGRRKWEPDGRTIAS